MFSWREVRRGDDLQYGGSNHSVWIWGAAAFAVGSCLEDALRNAVCLSASYCLVCIQRILMYNFLSYLVRINLSPVTYHLNFL
ncbi:hypothetical protein BJX96DRAFT_130367 [Aspergillus floccosus]